MLTPTQLEAKRQQHSDVPCGGCTACCKQDIVRLGPGDNLMAYRWHMEFGFPVLDRAPNGDCVYLDANGCTIHGAAPEICKRMDCRVLYQLTPPERRAQREMENPQMIRIYAAAETRMESLT